MTAVVGVLNKQAVAVAADSAVTIGMGNNRKILNHANKVFRLSHTEPIGIMIYNAANFMQTPWEIIIKVYRTKLGLTTFPKLEDYQQDFLTFLKNNHYYSTLKSEQVSILEFCQLVFETLKKEVATQQTKAGIVPVNISQAIQQTIDGIQAHVEAIYNNLSTHPPTYCVELADYTLHSFDTVFHSVFTHAIENCFLKIGLSITPQTIEQLKTIVLEVLKSQEFLNHYTGLIFMGYGAEEIFPSLIPLKISFAISDRLRYFVDSTMRTHITTDMYSAVRPFAQTDVISTILTGVDPQLSDIYIKNFGDFIQKYNQNLINTIGVSYPPLISQIQNFDIKLFITEYAQLNAKIQKEKYIDPLIKAVSMLSKEDLAEMAESLIYLTYLKRRITFAEESVGGPVDVAIISKSDGFIWVKRKQYIKPEINHHYFSNYLKS